MESVDRITADFVSRKFFYISEYISLLFVIILSIYLYQYIYIYIHNYIFSILFSSVIVVLRIFAFIHIFLYFCQIISLQKNKRSPLLYDYYYLYYHYSYHYYFFILFLIHTYILFRCDFVNCDVTLITRIADSTLQSSHRVYAPQLPRVASTPLYPLIPAPRIYGVSDIQVEKFPRTISVDLALIKSFDVCREYSVKLKTRLLSRL